MGVTTRRQRFNRMWLMWYLHSPSQYLKVSWKWIYFSSFPWLLCLEKGGKARNLLFVDLGLRRPMERTSLLHHPDTLVDELVDSVDPRPLLIVVRVQNAHTNTRTAWGCPQKGGGRNPCLLSPISRCFSSVDLLISDSTARWRCSSEEEAAFQPRPAPSMWGERQRGRREFNYLAHKNPHINHDNKGDFVWAPPSPFRPCPFVCTSLIAEIGLGEWPEMQQTCVSSLRHRLMVVTPSVSAVSISWPEKGWPVNYATYFQSGIGGSYCAY